MTTQNTTAVQETSIGLVIASVVLPIVGYVAFFINQDVKPEPAKHYLISAIVGSVLGILMLL